MAASAVLLAACAPNNGLTQARPDAPSFGDAHAQCWETSMNIAGHAASMAQSRAYEACMTRNGWVDQRSLM